MPQAQQTDDQIYADLLEDMESLKDLPESKGDNIELDDDDDRIFDELYPSITGAAPSSDSDTPE